MAAAAPKRRNSPIKWLWLHRIKIHQGLSTHINTLLAPHRPRNIFKASLLHVASTLSALDKGLRWRWCHKRWERTRRCRVLLTQQNWSLAIGNACQCAYTMCQLASKRMSFMHVKFKTKFVPSYTVRRCRLCSNLISLSRLWSHSDLTSSPLAAWLCLAEG